MSALCRSARIGARRLVMALVALTSVTCVLVGPASSSAAAKPVNIFPPEVVGSERVGERLVCGVGSWTGSVSKFEYEWVREGITVSARAAYNLTYTTSKADAHLAIWCVVWAEGSEGVSEPAESWNAIYPEGPPTEKRKEEVPPKIITPPEVTGGTGAKATVGQTLACSQGTWSGTPAPTYHVQVDSRQRSHRVGDQQHLYGHERR